MRKLERLILLLDLVRTRKKLKVSDLARECEVSERTIYRDIQTLSEARVPIYFDEGYKLLTGAFLPPLNLSAEELLTINLGLSSDLVQSIETLRKTAKQSMSKLQSLLSEKNKIHFENLSKLLVVESQEKYSQKKLTLIFDLLIQAISSKRKIKINFVSDHPSQVMKLEPERLIYKKGIWYLGGQKQKKKECLRLDIIKKVTFA